MVKVGIIGCGSITRLRHAPEYSENPEAMIVGFFDPRFDRAQEMVENFGGKVYANYEEMLADPGVDAVSVCTSNKYHAYIAIAALNAGKHVLCEKPIATSVEEAEQMIEAARDNGKFLMIGHNQRLAPVHIKAKEILMSGELGRILSFQTRFAHGGPESWSADKNRKTWFFNKQDAFMGAIGDLGIHKADLIRWLIEDEIEEVRAIVTTLDKKDAEGSLVEVDDNAMCIMRSRSGIIGTMVASWTCYGEEDNSTILYCTDGVIRICDDPEYQVIVIKRNGDQSFHKIGKLQTNDNQTNSGIINAFVDSIVKNITPEISGEEGLAALKIVLACIESSRRGESIKI